MTIRYAVSDDVPALSAVEAECFPPAEAATAAEFAERVAHYGKHFWLMYDGDKLISFVDGIVTDDADLTDEMYFPFLPLVSYLFIKKIQFCSLSLLTEQLFTCYTMNSSSGTCVPDDFATNIVILE